MDIITWDQLRNSVDQPLSGGDRIAYREEAIDEAVFELQLILGDGISKWKCITLTGGNVVDGISEIWIARVELEDTIAKGPVSFGASKEALKTAGIFFGKESDLGQRPSNNYYIPGPIQSGKRIYLTWIAD